MIPVLLSIPGKLKTLIDRLTLARALKIDEITPERMARLDAAMSSRAAASTALSNATWTDARAGKIDTLESRLTAARALLLDEIDDILADTAALDSRLTATRAGYLDASINSRAPASTALSNAIWTNARAALIDNLADGTSVINNVQRGTILMANSSTITDVTITAVNMSKSQLNFLGLKSEITTTSTLDTNSVLAMFKGTTGNISLINPTTIRASRGGTGGTITISWELIEYK